MAKELVIQQRNYLLKISTQLNDCRDHLGLMVNSLQAIVAPKIEFIPDMQEMQTKVIKSNQASAIDIQEARSVVFDKLVKAETTVEEALNI